MRVKTGNAIRGLIAAFLLAVIAFILLVQYAPDSAAFSPNNYGWNGLQGVASTYNVNFTTSLSGLPAKGILAILQPSVNYSSADADSVRSFLLAGGTVLVADKSGVANSLLQGIGSSITIEQQLSISDSVYNWKAKSVPTALVLPGTAARDPFAANASALALNQPSPLALSGSGATQVAVTSQFSETQTGSKGPFVVMASERMGAGTLIVVGDSQFLLNSEWMVANNRVLIGNLFANGNVFIDASHWTANPLASSTAQVKAELRQFYAATSTSLLRYAFALIIVGVALVLVPQQAKERAGASPGGARLWRRIRST
jgi:hypothetical protein